ASLHCDLRHFVRGGHSSDLILSVKHLFGINPYFLKVEANHRLKLVALLTFFAEALWRLPCQ
ncbi:hypothetical protein AAFX15_12975, partial [Vibrio chagasii]|uniref:hypothetical protein n=1 Tax=Vibrio chagasii TaxID=170679 RepID=UPI0038CEF0E1